MIAKMHSCERPDHFVKRSRDLESLVDYESLWSKKDLKQQLLSIQFASSRFLLSFLRLEGKQRANRDSRDPSCLCVDSRGYFCELLGFNPQVLIYVSH